MTKHRSHSAAFKRQVAQEFIAGETLHGLSKRHDLSRQLILIWVGKDIAGRYGQPEGIVEFAVGQQSGVGGDPRAVELQIQAAVEIEPERTIA